jgi:hypothetical protein
MSKKDKSCFVTSDCTMLVGKSLFTGKAENTIEWSSTIPKTHGPS